MRHLAIIWLCLVPVCAHAKEPFDLSLARSSSDSSPDYRTLIRRATELYRGDGPAHMITARSHRSLAAGFEIEEITDYTRGTIDLYLRHASSAGERAVVLSEAHFDSDPFPSDSAPLCITIGVDTRAFSPHVVRVALSL